MLIHNAIIVDGDSMPFSGWLKTNGAFIEAIGKGEPSAILLEDDNVVDAKGAYLMPGAIDCHVHFREPGLTHKATIAGESRAAVAGGVTSFIDMPNTVPTTTSIAEIEHKANIAAQDSVANYAFMIGATASNLSELQHADFSRIAAVKVFMGSSTGNMLLDDDAVLRAVFADQPGRIVVHAEDQSIINENIAKYSPIPNPEDMIWHSRLRSNLACVKATERAMEMATRYGSKLHIAHVTTREEVALFDNTTPTIQRQITAEVSPHHLLHTLHDYARLGSRIKMNPAVKDIADRDALREGLADGRIDIVATDHAPHCLEEKQGDVFKAMSGAPMIQFSLVAMMDLYKPSTVARRMASAPADLFGIDRRGRLKVGNYADMVLVEQLSEPHIITDSDVVSKCGWTPMIGYATHHRVVSTWVNGGQAPLPLRFN